LAVVLPVARLPAQILAPLSPAAPTAAALSIVDQASSPHEAVAIPLAHEQAGARPGPRSSGAAPDPLVPVSLALCGANGSIASGVGGMRSHAFKVERARPCSLM
jgi:hypothetical protein